MLCYTVQILHIFHIANKTKTSVHNLLFFKELHCGMVIFWFRLLSRDWIILLGHSRPANQACIVMHFFCFGMCIYSDCLRRSTPYLALTVLQTCSIYLKGWSSNLRVKILAFNRNNVSCCTVVRSQDYVSASF